MLTPEFGDLALGGHDELRTRCLRDSASRSYVGYEHRKTHQSEARDITPKTN